jgi:hypothetical protein
MKTYGVVDVCGIDIYFLIPALDGEEWSASRPCCLTPGETALGTHWIGGWVGPTAVRNAVEKRKFLTLPGLELRTPGRPVRNQSIYRQRYSGSPIYRYIYVPCNIYVYKIYTKE